MPVYAGGTPADACRPDRLPAAPSICAKSQYVLSHIPTDSYIEFYEAELQSSRAAAARVSQEYACVSPAAAYACTSPAYACVSQAYACVSPAYACTSPAYTCTSPAYANVTPVHACMLVQPSCPCAGSVRLAYHQSSHG